jgi:hypothetical protein
MPLSLAQVAQTPQTPAAAPPVSLAQAGGFPAGTPPPEDNPELSGTSLGVLPGAKPGYPGRQIWMHKDGKAYSTHLNSIETINGKDYILPTIYNGTVVSRDQARQIAIDNHLIDPETGHPFPEETGVIPSGRYKGWGQREKPLHDLLERQATEVLKQTPAGRRLLQERER